VALAFCASGLAGREQAGPARHYVSPSGSAEGRGTLESPWDLATALVPPPEVRPGDTIWLRGGTYAGTFTSTLIGSPDAPIVVRQYPGERAILDGGNAGQNLATLTVTGSDTWFWGFEITSSDPDRSSDNATSAPPDIQRPDGVQIAQSSTTGSGLRFINLVVHDNRQGISFWKEAVDAEVSGCIIYYNGWQGPDRGHGHGIYAQNRTGSKRIVDNIVFEQFGGGIQAYGSGAAFLNNFHVEGNTLFENGSLATTGASDNLLVGGGVRTNDATIVANMLYYDSQGDVPDSAFNFGYDAGCQNGTVTGNYIANNTYFVNCQPVSMTGNTFYGEIVGLSPTQYPDNSYLGAVPSGPQVFVRPNEYEAGRAHVTIFNWTRQESVAIDLAAVLEPGADYEVRNAQNYFGPPVAAGTWSGAPITLPMNGLSVASPVGWPAPAASGDIRVFVVLTTRSARGEPVSVPQPARRPPRVERAPAGD
jgi:hypothetical protein